MMHVNGQFFWNMLFEMKLIDFMSEENLKMVCGKEMWMFAIVKNKLDIICNKFISL